MQVQASWDAHQEHDWESDRDGLDFSDNANDSEEKELEHGELVDAIDRNVLGVVVLANLAWLLKEEQKSLVELLSWQSNQSHEQEDTI